jgi:hypothetical protein
MVAEGVPWGQGRVRAGFLYFLPLVGLRVLVETLFIETCLYCTVSERRAAV